MPYGSTEEGVGLNLPREIKEVFMEEVTTNYNLKARGRGSWGLGRRHSRQWEQ